MPRLLATLVTERVNKAKALLRTGKSVKEVNAVFAATPDSDGKCRQMAPGTLQALQAALMEAGEVVAQASQPSAPAASVGPLKVAVTSIVSPPRVAFLPMAIPVVPRTPSPAPDISGELSLPPFPAGQRVKIVMEDSNGKLIAAPTE